MLDSTEQLASEDRITEILSTMVDSIELVETISVLRQNEVNVPPTLLKRAFSGPTDVFKEDESSNHARNAMFELSMGAMVARQGLRPALNTGNPDVSFQFEGRSVKMECKRVLSESKIMERLREGIKQLGKSVQTGSSDVGLVAISLSKLLNPGDKFLVADSPHDALSDEITKALRANEQSLGSMTRPQAAGFLFYVSSASLVPGKGYTPVRAGTFFPLNMAEKPFLKKACKQTACLGSWAGGEDAAGGTPPTEGLSYSLTHSVKTSASCRGAGRI